MKTKIILLGIIAVTLLTLVGTAFATKNNQAGAQKYGWHLSADVMPVPPYGSLDIPGSDTASKLIVNQPNGKVQAMVTGVMNGLNPDTTYTVYLSNPYTLDVERWDVTGTYRWLVLSTYDHDLVITTQNPDGTFSGTGGYPAGSSPYTDPGQTSETITGQVIENQITFTTTYAGWPYSVTVLGTIAHDGSMSGTSPWEWHTTSGAATSTMIGSGWTGQFGNTAPFTFTTDDTGSGSWHVNLRAGDFSGTGQKSLSVWINEAGRTMLISDVFTVTV